MISLRSTCLFAAMALAPCLSLGSPLVASEIGGEWRASVPVPGQVEFHPLEMVLTPDGDHLTAQLRVASETFTLKGSLDRVSSSGKLSGTLRGTPVQLECTLRQGELIGSIHLGGGPIPIHARRPGPALDEVEPLEVDFDVERPETITLNGLPLELGEEISELIHAEMGRMKAVGVSAAFVLDGEVVDLRSFGWEDFAERIPADGDTMYRWASIAKPVTAVAALQLVAAGKLDLDQDIRKYVPEFPEKRWPITARHLLLNQSGVVHYAQMRIRTPKEYTREHPWTDRIISLDMFNESPLLFEPGTRYHYSTPGFVLLGAVIERAGGQPFEEQVIQRICQPLGMSTMQPDVLWKEIPHRTEGYERLGNGAVAVCGDDNISWKLPAGGWTSNVRDLGWFGVGLMDSTLLNDELRAEMCTAGTLADGKATTYGYGLGIREVDGRKLLVHSGGQLRTSTFLIVDPDNQTAVALMCNTGGARMQDLALSCLTLLNDRDD